MCNETDEANMTDSYHNDVPPYGDNVIDNYDSTVDVTEDCNELINEQCVSVLSKSFSANANENTTELNTKVGFEEQIARIRAETRIMKRKCEHLNRFYKHREVLLQLECQKLNLVMKHEYDALQDNHTSEILSKTPHLSHENFVKISKYIESLRMFHMKQSLVTSKILKRLI